MKITTLISSVIAKLVEADEKEMAELPALYPHLKPIKEDYKAAKKNLVAELKANFKGEKFSVRVDRYTYLISVLSREERVDRYAAHISTALSREEVEKVTNKFKNSVSSFCGDFTDLNESNFNKVFGGFSHIFIDQIKTKMKTLKTFLEKNNACANGFEFAKNLTLEQFLETCPRGDWILWLFARTNPNSLKELTLAKAHCANTVRHLMKNDKSLNAVDVGLAFGEGLATREELADAADVANAAYANAAYARAAHAYAAAYAAYVAKVAYTNAAYAANVANAAVNAAVAAAYAAAASDASDAAGYAADAAGYAAVSAGDSAFDYALEQNQKQTADICRKFLPIQIWDQSQF